MAPKQKQALYRLCFSLSIKEGILLAQAWVSGCREPESRFTKSLEGLSDGAVPGVPHLKGAMSG